MPTGERMHLPDISWIQFCVYKANHFKSHCNSHSPNASSNHFQPMYICRENTFNTFKSIPVIQQVSINSTVLFCGTPDPMSVDVFKGPCFTCVSEGLGAVRTTWVAAKGLPQSSVEAPEDRVGSPHRAPFRWLTLWDEGCGKAGSPSHQVWHSPGVAPPNTVNCDDDDEGSWELNKCRIEEIQIHVVSSHSHVHDEPLVEDGAREPGQRRASWIC